MKPEEMEDNIKDVMDGDRIGDTVYCERFVLKILMKLANLDILKDEIQEKDFEDELSILWDMAVDRDVVLYLQKQNILNIINFALPTIPSSRIIEILIGLVGNMCCEKEVVMELMKFEDFLSCLFKYASSDDSLVLIQLLRLFNACLFLADDSDASIWMSMFVTNEYSPILYYILRNSSNKDLLVTAIEHLKTIFIYCNTEKNRIGFFTQFIITEAIQSLSAALKEIAVEHKDELKRDDLEQIMTATLQIVLYITEFDKSAEIYKDSKEDVSTIFSIILDHHDSKFVEDREIDGELISIIENIVIITNILKINENCDPCKYFYQSYSLWKVSSSIKRCDNNNPDSFEEDEKEELHNFADIMTGMLSKLLCTYITQCCEEYLLTVLDHISSDFDDIVSFLDDENLLNAVYNRTESYRIR